MTEYTESLDQPSGSKCTPHGYLDLKRISVDIDLNYIAHIDREATQRERPEIVQAIEQIATGLKYKLQNGVDEHALREWYLNYSNYTGKPDRIQIEINFLMRACALPSRVLAAAPLAEAPPCQFLLLETEELFGGKISTVRCAPILPLPIFSAGRICNQDWQVISHYRT